MASQITWTSQTTRDLLQAGWSSTCQLQHVISGILTFQCANWGTFLIFLNSPWPQLQLASCHNPGYKLHSLEPYNLAQTIPAYLPLSWLPISRNKTYSSWMLWMVFCCSYKNWRCISVVAIHRCPFRPVQGSHKSNGQRWICEGCCLQ